MFILLLSAGLAHAGKLNDGFRGIAWGAHETFPAPGDNCRANPEPAVAWVCDQTIGDIPVTISYLYQNKLFSSAFVRTKGFSACSGLMDVLSAAYGTSKPLKDFATAALDDRYWTDNEVWGSWDYNKFSGECTFAALHNPSIKSIEAEKKKNAAKAVSDL